MASDSGGSEDGEAPTKLQEVQQQAEDQAESDPNSKDGTDDDDEGDEDVDEEPILKYASLTKGQGSVYRNGDAVSAFLVAGDKMITGTHNGYIHVLSLPSFKSLRSYKAHSASVSSISVSPYPPPLPSTKSNTANRSIPEQKDSKSQASSQSSAKGSRQQNPIPNTPSNSIHIATSSIDGNVCVFSLTDPKDVILRNFGRPVQSIALSPDYKNDRSYLSGGLAGNLVLTVGGRIGASANANTSGAAAAAAGWLNTIGIGGQNGADTVLHSGEGIINTVKWSLSGRFVVWVNEKGIKIMRSNLHLESHESEFAWKRIGHIDRPTRQGWDEMAGMWRARAEWIDEDGLEADDGRTQEARNFDMGEHNGQGNKAGAARKDVKGSLSRRERLVVGWGDFIWLIDVHPGGIGVGRDAGERKMGGVKIITKLRTDCIVSGVSLYTPNLISVLAYITPTTQENGKEATAQTSPRRGIQRRQNALQPEMRIIDLNTKEEICVADTLTVSRFESLSATDYHLGVLPVIRGAAKVETHKGALEVIGGVGGSIWDATMYPVRLFGSAASVRSFSSASDKVSGSQVTVSDRGNGSLLLGPEPHPALLTRGMKIFIQSPYDCVLATKPSLSDHLVWLDEHEKYEEAWNLLDIHPESSSALSGKGSGTSTPTAVQGASVQLAQGQKSLAEFFADDSSQTTDSKDNMNSQANKRKRHIGEKWLQQLVKEGKWATAGQTCGKVLDNASSWERWVWVFAEANQFEAITPFIPSEQLRPPISSTVYEIVLGHYISEDRLKLAELLEKWEPELFDVGSVVSTIESRLKAGDIGENSTEDGDTGRDWRILTRGLAKLYLADGRARDALRCYIKLKDADAAMQLIASHHLMDTVADDIPGVILLRVSKEQLKRQSQPELEEASVEPIRLLVSEAHHGVVKPDTVIKQLNTQKDMKLFLYFYLRDLWNGDTVDTASKGPVRRSRFDATNPFVAEGRSLVNDSADTALNIFAEFNQALLFEFLKASQSYTLSTATSLCESRGYIDELVFLLAKEGQTKRALRTIINKLSDVSRAISFAKEQDDPDLWNDLLNYSMNKPDFVRALLEEVGTAIDPITLVRRIPEGLEIPGLRNALTRMVKEYELQDSISEGVMRVLRGEVASSMTALRSSQKRGIRFDIIIEERPKSQGHSPAKSTKPQSKRESMRSGFCCGCGDVIFDGETGPLISFPCMHAFHLSCLLTHDLSPPGSPLPDTPKPQGNNADKDPAKLTTFPSVEDPLEGEDLDGFSGGADHGIGPKVKFAKELRVKGKVQPGVGCPLEIHRHRNADEI